MAAASAILARLGQQTDQAVAIVPAGREGLAPPSGVPDARSRHVRGRPPPRGSGLFVFEHFVGIASHHRQRDSVDRPWDHAESDFGAEAIGTRAIFDRAGAVVDSRLRRRR